MDRDKSKFFKVYIYIALFLIIFLLGSLVAVIIYASFKVKNESVVISNNVNSKVNSFNKNIDSVNQNLVNINNQLQKQNSQVSKSLSTSGL